MSLLKLLKGCQYVPRLIIPDKLKSYGAAKREILPGVEHRQRRYLNNRAENSHQPSTARRKFVSCLQHRVVYHNNYFPRAKLARYVRCAALAVSGNGACRGSSPRDTRNSFSPRMGLLPSISGHADIASPRPHTVKRYKKDVRCGARSQVARWPPKGRVGLHLVHSRPPAAPKRGQDQ